MQSFKQIISDKTLWRIYEKASSFYCNLIFTCLLFSSGTESDNSQLGDPIQAYLNLNNISTVFKNDGISDINIGQDVLDLYFLKDLVKLQFFNLDYFGVQFLIDLSEEDPHVGGSVYRSGLQGGKIISLVFLKIQIFHTLEFIE